MLCFSNENHHFDFLFYIICELQKTKVISLLSFILYHLSSQTKVISLLSFILVSFILK